MDWVTCPRCGFTQIPTEKCLRCARPLAAAGVPPPPQGEPAPAPAPEEPVSAEAAPRRPVPEGAPAPAPAPAPFSAVPPESSPDDLARPVRPRAPAAAIAAGAVLLAIVILLALRTRSEAPGPSAPARAAAAAAPARLDLSGRWEAQFSKTLPGSPPRPALKQAYLETGQDGAILAAGVLLTDPGLGGVGAGYRVASDGVERLGRISSLLASSPGGAALPIDFIPFPAWMPPRDRVWRALEGQSRRASDVRYLLLESVEDDYLVQAGINQSGFLSYAFFSRDYARNRGVDALSAIIHPDPGSSLRGFQNLVWDFSGAADFLALEVNATLSGPEGTRDRLILKRGTARPAS